MGKLKTDLEILFDDVLEWLNDVKDLGYSFYKISDGPNAFHVQ